MSEVLQDSVKHSDSRYENHLSGGWHSRASLFLKTRKQKGERDRPSRRRHRKLSKEDALLIIRDRIAELSRETALYYRGVVTVEGISSELDIKPKTVRQVFAILNREGLLSHCHNNAPGKTWRSGGFDAESAWKATEFALVTQVVKERPVRDDDVQTAPSNPPGTMNVWSEKSPVKKPRFSKRLQRRVG